MDNRSTTVNVNNWEPFTHPPRRPQRPVREPEEWESPYAHQYIEYDKRYKNTDEFKFIFDHVYNWCRSHHCLPQGVLNANHDMDVEIMGKRYRDFSRIEEMAYRRACYRLEEYFEVCCQRF